MGFFKKLFTRKKKAESEEENWEQPVFSHDEVDFSDTEQRNRYVTNCLEQIVDASKEIDLLTGEYNLVTAYLTDMEEIEALPSEEKGELENIANKLLALEQERKHYTGRKDKMNDADYFQMRRQEEEVVEGIEKLRKEEDEAVKIKQDLQRLDRERSAYQFRRAELISRQGNQRGMAVIFLTALAICLVMLLILQFGFEMNTQAGYLVSVLAASIAIGVLCIKYMDADKELIQIERTINRLIQLQNKVKIRYVNNANLLSYLYMKYNTESASKLEKLWNQYLREKEERKQFAEAEAKTEFYQKQLVDQISRYRVRDPVRWINQAGALVDKREMVEIRHDLILRRQALRKQMDYNQEVRESARREINVIVEQHPAYSTEIRGMVERYKNLI